MLVQAKDGLFYRDEYSNQAFGVTDGKVLTDLVRGSKKKLFTLGTYPIRLVQFEGFGLHFGRRVSIYSYVPEGHWPWGGVPECPTDRCFTFTNPFSKNRVRDILKTEKITVIELGYLRLDILTPWPHVKAALLKLKLD